MNIFEKRRAQEQVEKDMQEARIESARSRRESRELKRAQSTGNVSFFLRKRADSNEVLQKALGVIEASNKLSSVQASIEYQKAVTTKMGSIDGNARPKTEMQSSIETVLPPRPNNTKLYILGVRNTELIWIPTENC